MASHMQQRAGKTSIKGAVNTVSLLLIFLLSIAAFSLGSLYFELRYKHQLLVAEVAQLKDSQILFMVPDEQAEVMANWMAENPVFVQSFIARARKGEITTMPIGDGSVEQNIAKQAVQTVINAAVNMDSTPPTSASNEVSNEVSNETATVVLDAAAVVIPAKVQMVTVAANDVNNETNIETATVVLDAAAVVIPVKAQMVTVAANDVNNDVNNETATVVLDAAAVVIPVKAQMVAVAANEVSNDVNNETATVVLDAAAVVIPVKAQMLTVAADGVNLISLPHGGIRITTRTLEE
ncbi:hypothetical protein L2755_13760 [Shewanella abyssi]|uniref:hypothetical protein n=1 Tax=Shewanella abyssi TaxID=311789 RepID=UPI00200E4D96|nr:hypothetical protein [Shewanella abyssi]MCL1050679.1 hypothetical protein [Shewanella abyssi]